MNRCILLNLDYFYNTYAIVTTTDDKMYNDDECELIIFKNKKEYDEFIKCWKEEQPYTGRTWNTLYLKNEK